MNNFTIVNKTTALLAKRNSGKSVLLKHLVESERHKFNKIFVICPTEKINRFYSDIVSDECIYDTYEEKFVDKLIIKMTEVNANKPVKERKNVLLILMMLYVIIISINHQVLKNYLLEVDILILLLF